MLDLTVRIRNVMSIYKYLLGKRKCIVCLHILIVYVSYHLLYYILL